MEHLDQLESQSIYIIREAFRKFEKLGMLWSVGKDSNVMLWLARKAFFGYVPFPVLHVDTSKKIPEMIEFRDKMAAEWGLDLIVKRNEKALTEGIDPGNGRVICCNALKTQPLKGLIEEYGFRGVFAGIRGDEEGTRSKERFFSPRGEEGQWEFTDQPPEFWNQFNTDYPKGTHVRIHPLLGWAEVDVWRYIKRENIPVVELYFSKKGKRYRSLGCAPCTSPIDSEAKNIDEIIKELETTNIAERSGRAQDKESEDAFERLRREGYM